MCILCQKYSSKNAVLPFVKHVLLYSMQFSCKVCIVLFLTGLSVSSSVSQSVNHSCFYVLSASLKLLNGIYKHMQVQYQVQIHCTYCQKIPVPLLFKELLNFEFRNKCLCNPFLTAIKYSETLQAFTLGHNVDICNIAGNADSRKFWFSLTFKFFSC